MWPFKKPEPEHSVTPQRLALVVDLDERGWFKAHVQEQNGQTVFEFSNEDEDTGWPLPDGIPLVTDGFIRHGRDVVGLLEYLQSIGIAQAHSTLFIAR